LGESEILELSQEPGLALWRILGRRRRKVAGGELVGRIECGGAISLVCGSGDLLRIYRIAQSGGLFAVRADIGRHRFAGMTIRAYILLV
jgi:hypothetical protein